MRRTWEVWELNRFWSQDPCQKGTLVQIQLLILIDIILATVCVIASSSGWFRTLVSIHAKASTRASAFVQVFKEVIR